MSISFEDSLNKAKEDLEAKKRAKSKRSAVATIDDGMSSGVWLKVEDLGYEFYDEYSDENMSTVDEDKKITLHPKQINITQETNSQYIPFQMPRYYDGYDLANAKLQIFFVNKAGAYGVDYPVDVYCNDDTLRFAWLVDEDVTMLDGKVEFEIQAIGLNSKGEAYIWKTRPNSDMNIILSLSGTKFIEPDDTWKEDFMSRINDAVIQTAEHAKEAGEFADDAKASLDATKVYAAEAATSATETKALVEELQGGIGDEVQKVFGEQIEETVVEKVTAVMGNYYTKPEVDELINNIDISDQLDEVKQQIAGLDGLAKFNVEYDGSVMTFYNGEAIIKRIEINSDPTEEWTSEYTASIEQKIIDAVDPLKSDLQGLHDDIDGLPETLQEDYYTKTDADSKFAVVSDVDKLKSDVSANTTNISAISSKVTEMDGVVSKVDTSPRLSYDATYEEDGTFTLWEQEGDDEDGRTAKSQFKLQGGSGGGGTSSILKIEYITTTPIVATLNDKVIIKYNFSGTDSSGDSVMEGTATWKVGSTTVATNTAKDGENSFDITDYVSLGSQKVKLSITDDAGSLVTKTWTVQKIDVRVESTFDDALTYPIAPVQFAYTPYGAIAKTVHFCLDGSEIGTVQTATSGVPQSFTIAQQEHGAHLLDVYMTASVNGSDIESNHITKDILWFDSTSDIPVIGCAEQEFTVRQYDTKNITYVVHSPLTETPTVSLAIDGNLVSTMTVSSGAQVWQFKSEDVGEHTLTITCGETVKTITCIVDELDIDVEPVMAGLEFDFNPTGKSNNDTDRVWSNGNVSMSVSDNFDWVNGGYQLDENGDSYFCVKSGTTATINYNLFSDDPKRYGKEFKVIFKTTNVKKRDTSFLSCMEGDIGLDMKVESANIYSSNDSLYSPYCEDDIIEFEFNINKNTDIPMVLTYEDGVANRPMIYTSDASFRQTNPVPITIGSEDCDVYVYRMKAYSNSLTDMNILSNFIADARNADEMVARYERNQIYDENGQLTPEVLAEKCPDLRVIIVDAPWFTNDKSNKVENTTVRMIYKNGDPVLDNWTCTGAKHSGQGTSSNEYGYSGRNLDLIMNGSDAEFTMGDGVTKSKTITLTRDSTPTNYLNVKVNIASSENENNAQMTMRFNEYQPYMRPARLRDSKIRDTMEFYNCIVFVRESNEDISTHREFTDTSVHYYALGNVGDSKKTDNTRVNDSNDPKEHVIEIKDYNVALAEFPTGHTDHDGNKAICPVDQWKPGNAAYDYLYAPYEYKDGEFSTFGSKSYEFRYEMKGISSEQRDENVNAWREAYKFVVTSSDEEFYSNFNKYFVQDSILYFYLFTERYTMVDNRAKNCFVHYGKAYYSTTEAEQFKEEFGVDIESEYINDEQAAFNGGYRYDLTFGYDFDTCLGIDNTGKLVLTYGKEDVDFYVDGEPSSSYIYRAAESTFFCRVRDLFASELQAMYVDRENVNAWSADSLINQWDTVQSQFPEEIWRLDIQRKYTRTYMGASIDGSIAGTANPRFLTEMLNGRKKYQRRMFERNQELYFATKYFGNRATQDQIMMRFNNPVGATIKQDFTLYITPYSDMYIGVKFGNVSPTNFRAKAGVEYTIPYGIDADTADITLIYGASFIQAIGDLSKCYVGDNDFSKATRLQKLVIGNNTDGYANTYMTKISLGNNKLLEYLDLQNITGLNSVVDLSQCNNLLELHAEGSGATGAIFANGGKLEKAYLPSVVSLTVKNLNNLKEFTVADYSNLQTLIVEGTPFINTYDIVRSATKLNILRLVNMDWNSNLHIENTNILNRLMKLRGIGNDGYETEVSVLTGNFHAATMKQKELGIYEAAWKDLNLTYDTLVEQYTVTFKNTDGTVLEVQYVDNGGSATDPSTRIDAPIVPTMPSTVQYDYEFDGWDSPLSGIFSDRVITAKYNAIIRSYTVKYVARGIVKQESVGRYGDYITYDGDTPVYTDEEPSYAYYLFNRWDKSGMVNGDKTINAIFDKFTYSEGAFDDKELSDLTPVELYAISKLGKASSIIEDKDAYTITLGNDVTYDDISETVIISEKTEFNGGNYIDTGIKLFDEDKDFVLAIDYEFGEGNKTNSVLAQCFQSNGTNGFKLWYSDSTSYSGSKFTWGTSAENMVAKNKREMLIIRHVKGDNNLIIYNSNLDGDSVSSVELTRTRTTVSDAPLVFGAALADDGVFENYATGTINWCKLWFADLGDATCRNLAIWTHEQVDMEACGFRKYYLTENPSQRCSFSLLATHLLDRDYNWSAVNSNAGGFASSALREMLNNRLYKAIPTQIRSIIKEVNVPSSVGSKSTEIVTSNCYITVPARVELDTSATDEPYINEGGNISYIYDNNTRKRAHKDGTYSKYWLRSPNASYTNYVYTVNADGALYGFNIPTYSYGILIEISI